METSAKTATNVDTAFTKTAELILNQIEQGHIDATNEVNFEYLDGEIDKYFNRQLE